MDDRADMFPRAWKLERCLICEELRVRVDDSEPDVYNARYVVPLSDRCRCHDYKNDDEIYA